MKLADLLLSRRDAIVERWKELTFQVYPDDSARFLRREKDRFGNPVGYRIGAGLETLYDGLAGGRPERELEPPLDDIVRIRVVQELTHAQALEFVFQLKQAVRDEIGPDVLARLPPAELLDLDSRIDRLALQAFGIFATHLEKLHELRVNECRRGAAVLLKREAARAAEEKGGYEA